MHESYNIRYDLIYCFFTESSFLYSHQIYCKKHDIGIPVLYYPLLQKHLPQVKNTTKFLLFDEHTAVGEFLVGFEGLESTLRIGLAVGRPWSQNHKYLVVASAFHRLGAPAVANPIPSR